MLTKASRTHFCRMVIFKTFIGLHPKFSRQVESPIESSRPVTAKAAVKMSFPNPDKIPFNKPVQPPPPGVQSNFEHPNMERVHLLVATVAVTLGLAIIFLVARLYTRIVMVRNFGWDDAMAIFATVLTVAFNAATLHGTQRRSGDLCSRKIGLDENDFADRESAELNYGLARYNWDVRLKLYIQDWFIYFIEVSAMQIGAVGATRHSNASLVEYHLCPVLHDSLRCCQDQHPSPSTPHFRSHTQVYTLVHLGYFCRGRFHHPLYGHCISHSLPPTEEAFHLHYSRPMRVSPCGRDFSRANLLPDRH